MGKKNRLIVGEPEPGAETTRQRLLEAAGEVFGELGFARATGKEICERAGTRAAAVNYHFGGMLGLYAAAVEEAVGRLATFETLAAAVAAHTTAAERLEAYLETLLRALTGPAGASWPVRLLSRELIAPSPELEAFRERQLFPRMRLLRELVGELLGVPDDHPAVARGCASVMGPCFLLLTCGHGVLQRGLPALDLGPHAADDLVRHMVDFARGGLAAIRVGLEAEARPRRRRGGSL